MLNFVVGLLVTMLALPVSALAAEKTVVGSATADAAGQGSINVPVNASLEPQAVADDVRANLELTNQATADVVAPDPIQEGTVRIDFSQAAPGSTVEAILPEDVNRRILGAGLAAGGGMTPGATLGIAALAVTGGVLGYLAASGEFDSDQAPATLTK